MMRRRFFYVFGQPFDGWTAWSELESRQSYGAFSNSINGSELKFSLRSFDVLFGRYFCK